MSEILFIDPLSESGHKNFNKNFIGYFHEYEAKLFCSGQHIMTGIDGATFSARLLSKKVMILYRLFQIYILLKSLYLISRSDSKFIVFLSYELVTFSLISHLISFFCRDKKVYVVEHNTFVPDNVLKLKLFLSINKKITHICLADYIASKIATTGRKTLFISHPFSLVGIDRKLKNINSDYAFMPSSNIEASKLKLIKDIFIKTSSEICLIHKSLDEYSSSKIIGKTFFKNYSELLVSARVIFIPQEFNYRVSGVFFETIANSNALVVMSKCKFSFEMEALFGNNILVIDDYNSADNIVEEILSVRPDFTVRKAAVLEVINRTQSNIRETFYE